MINSSNAQISGHRILRRDLSLRNNRCIDIGINPTKVLAPGLVGMDAVVRHPDAKPHGWVCKRPGGERFGGFNAEIEKNPIYFTAQLCDCEQGLTLE